MDKRFVVKLNPSVDPPQYEVRDRVDLSVIVRYADKERADEVCRDFNNKIG